MQEKERAMKLAIVLLSISCLLLSIDEIINNIKIYKMAEDIERLKRRNQ